MLMMIIMIIIIVRCTIFIVRMIRANRIRSTILVIFIIIIVIKYNIWLHNNFNVCINMIVSFHNINALYISLMIDIIISSSSSSIAQFKNCNVFIIDFSINSRFFTINSHRVFGSVISNEDICSNWCYNNSLRSSSSNNSFSNSFFYISNIGSSVAIGVIVIDDGCCVNYTSIGDSYSRWRICQIVIIF
ncbi:hypothetical protein [Mauternbach virus]|uniref:Uncharacterized protein n=1 Tax=Mauternbach virus TaxID=2486603 RepID=A0A3G3E670_9VIRU|nr:hypothetical protein QKM05_gp82 [Mauternbach virus]AYP97966.1 hypothetical protein [Mauternbach virus]